MGDTLIISDNVTRICIPSAELLLLPDSVVEDPFGRKGNGYTVYVTKE